MTAKFTIYSPFITTFGRVRHWKSILHSKPTDIVLPKDFVQASVLPQELTD